MRRSLDIGDVLTRVFQTYGNHVALILPPIMYFDLRAIEADDRTAQAAAAPAAS